MLLKNILRKSPFFDKKEEKWRQPLKWLVGQRAKYLTLHNPKKRADEMYLKYFGKHIDWDNPQTMVEKQRWLLHNTDTTEWSRLADKYAVREYVKEKGLGDILIPLLGKWDKAEDIDFDKLPDQFVIKCNHGSGDVIIVKDKKTADLKFIRKQMDKHVSKLYGYDFAEIHYLKIKPCIIAEELLQGNDDLSTSIIDYKFYTVCGEPKYCGVFYDRQIGKREHPSSFYDMKWNKISGEKDIPRPKNLSRMIEVCGTLCTQFSFVRMDFYEVNDKLYFGEMTFTPAALNKTPVQSLQLITELGKMMKI